MKAKKVLFPLLLLVFNSFLSYAQISSGEFSIGGSQSDVGSAITQTKDGGYIIAGSTSSFGKNATNMYVVKLDSNAGIQWTRVISDTFKYANSEATSIIQTKNGEYALVGYESGAGEPGVFFVILNSAGNLVWSKIYEGVYYWALPYSLIQTRDGGYAVTGTNVDETSHSVIFILKLDSLGNIQWSNNLTAARNNYPEDQGNSIIQTNDDGYAIAGTIGYLTGSDMYVAKLDSTGKLLWGKKTNRTLPGWAGFSVVQTYDSCLVLLGNISYTSLYKLNSNGNVIWSEIINGVFSNSLVQTCDHGFAIAGDIYHGGGEAIYFAKVDSDGHVQWNRIIGGGTYYPYTYNLSANSLIQARDKGFALGGSSSIDSSGSFTPNENVLFLKIDSVGELCLYDSIATSYLSADLLYNNDSTFTNAWTVSSRYLISSGGIETSICYPFTLGIQALTQPHSEVSIYPNPNNGIFTIAISHPELVSESQIIEVYNMLGEKINIATLKQVQPDYEINMSNQPSGIYLYRVLNEDRSLVGEGKLIIQK